MSQNVSSAVMAQRHEPVDSLDYFPTPPWATRAFMREHLQAHKCPRRFERIWEPACGEGHMVAVLREFASDVRGSDVRDYGRGFSVGSFVGQGLDVMPPWPTCDWVITNPPFNLAIEFAHRALEEALDGVALLVRTAWVEGGDRYERLFSPHPPTQIVHYSERVPMVAGRYDPKARSATAYSWFIWERDADRRPDAWIAPGAKDRNFRLDDVRRWCS